MGADGGVDGIIKQDKLGLGALYRPEVRLCIYSVLLIFCAASIILACFTCASQPFTDHRLMPLLMFRDHLPVYTEPNTGPMLSTLYPPLSVLLYAPVALLNSPRAMFFWAGLLSQVFCLLPLLVGLYVSSDHESTIGFQTFAFRGLIVATGFILWCNLSDVMSELFAVHADTPALFLGAVGFLLFAAYTRRGHPILLVLSALCCSLAPWAKQTAAPAILIIPTILIIKKQFRLLAFYVVSVICTETVLLLVAHWTFDLRLMFLWLITIPSKHPWRSVWSTAFDEANRVLLRENFTSVVVLGSVVFLRVRHSDNLWHGLQNVIKRPWGMFALAGLFFWPTSILGYVKVGAARNSLLFTTYFLNISLALFAFEAMGDKATFEARKLSYSIISVILLLLSIPMTTTLAKSVVHPKRLLSNSNEEVYEFLRRSPGEVYFPWHPLSTYLAEGKVYNSDLGVCDRIMAGIPIDVKNFRAYVPSSMRYIAYKEYQTSCVHDLLPEFNKIVQDPRLPGWVVYVRK